MNKLYIFYRFISIYLIYFSSYFQCTELCDIVDKEEIVKLAKFFLIELSIKEAEWSTN